jgi:small-conductance mechanosensitive channel
VAGFGGELLRHWNEEYLSHATDLATRALFAILAVALVWLLGRLAVGATRRGLTRTRANANARLLVDRLVQFTFLIAAGAWALSILGVELTALVAVVGAAALAVSLALQDVLKNLVAGLYILVERPFTIGDHIEFKTFTGTVETIELRTTALRTTAGQRVVIPNAMLFADALVNRSVYGRQLVRLRVVLSGEGIDRTSADAALAAAREALPDQQEASLLLESMTKEKVTLRLEGWASDGRRAAQEVAWRLRERLPAAEVTVLE